VGDPRLGAVDDPAVAVEHRLGLQGRGVGAAAGLGQAVRAEQLTAEHVGQPAGALLVGAEGGEGVAGEGVDARPEPDRQPARG
jgi:hypothetical protein